MHVPTCASILSLSNAQYKAHRRLHQILSKSYLSPAELWATSFFFQIGKWYGGLFYAQPPLLQTLTI